MPLDLNAASEQNMNFAGPGPERLATIRALNDALRRTGRGGRALMTAGVAALPPATLSAVLRAVASFDAFDADNDPHGEHDFAALEVAGHRIMFQVDTYDRQLEFGSPDPADPAVTCRVLTALLAEEY